MRQVTITHTINIPTVDEFTQSGNPKYSRRVHEDGAALFNLVMQPEVFLDAEVCVRLLDLPAVTAVAQRAIELMPGGLGKDDRPYLGSLIAALMRANGYDTAGRQGSIPHRDWGRGELYAKRAAA